MRKEEYTLNTAMIFKWVFVQMFIFSSLQTSLLKEVEPIERSSSMQQKRQLDEIVRFIEHNVKYTCSRETFVKIIEF